MSRLPGGVFVRVALGSVPGGSGLVFVGGRGKAAAGGVAAFGVVPVDVAGDGGFRLGAGGELVVGEELEFEGGVPGLDDGVVQCRSGAAPARCSAPERTYANVTSTSSPEPVQVGEAAPDPTRPRWGRTA